MIPYQCHGTERHGMAINGVHAQIQFSGCALVDPYFSYIQLK